MGYPIHPLSNVGVAGQYLNQLSTDNLSQQYFSGQQAYTGGFFQRLKLLFSINGTLKQLKNFYPYVPVVTKSEQAYTKQMNKAISNSLVLTAVSWFTIFNLARRGKVLPFFSQYGKYFKTHRILRQYVFTLVAPFAFFTSQVDFEHLNNTQHLWAVHSRRMNKQLTADPLNSEYPEELLPLSWIGSWVTIFKDPVDLKKQTDNEVHILKSPDYAQIQFQNQEVQTPQEQGQEEQEDQ